MIDGLFLWIGAKHTTDTRVVDDKKRTGGKSKPQKEDAGYQFIMPGSRYSVLFMIDFTFPIGPRRVTCSSREATSIHATDRKFMTRHERIKSRTRSLSVKSRSSSARSRSSSPGQVNLIATGRCFRCIPPAPAARAVVVLMAKPQWCPASTAFTPFAIHAFRGGLTPVAADRRRQGAQAPAGAIVRSGSTRGKPISVQAAAIKASVCAPSLPP